jgi:hypothetical protein
MIFPELPKRYRTVLEPYSVQTPLHSIEVQEEPVKVDVEAWFIKQGLAGDPAASPSRIDRNQQINWLSWDAGEFYLLCTVYAVWLAYWLGIHRSWW